MIHCTRELTNRPFGVNLWLHRALRPPIDPDAIREEALRGAQEMLNRFRQRLGIPTTMARPARAPDLVDAAIKVVLDERQPSDGSSLGWSTTAIGAASRSWPWSRPWRTRAPRRPAAPT
jgi:hypothetical protein